VKRGAYEVIRADDSQTISPSKFARSVEPGMVLELSIILWQDEGLQDNKDKCPRCHHINRSTTINRGWIEWKVILFSYILIINTINTVPDARDSSRLQKMTRITRILIMCAKKEVIHKLVMRLKEDPATRAVENKMQSGMRRATAQSLMMRLFHLLRM
jgi:hypothetical protein